MDKHRKELHWHIKQRLNRGCALNSIKEEFRKVGYKEDYIEKLFRGFLFKQYAVKSFLYSIIPIILVMSLLIVKPNITGQVAYEQNYNYTDQISIAFNQNDSYVWNLGNRGNLTSISLSGSITKAGFAKVYLLYENERYLVFDSTQLDDTALMPITGAATTDLTNESMNVTDKERTIRINLAYQDNSQYDTNNDGVESTDGIIDFTVEDSSFSWDVNKSNLCTKWEVYNQQSSTFVCYGAERCCNFIDLTSSSENWNDSFNLNYGKYGAGLDNTVAAQIIYADYSLDAENAYSNIYYSDLSSLKAVFQAELFSFKDICLETCILPQLGYDNYTLIVEINNATLNINSISYIVKQSVTNITNVTIVNETLIQHKAVINEPVKWSKKVRLSKISSNLSVEIPEEAVNITVTKIENGYENEAKNAFIKVDNDKAKLKLYNQVVKDKKSKRNKNSTVIIEEPVEEVNIEYYTEAPLASEEIIKDYSKKIVISSDTHYTDILAKTSLPLEATKASVHLYWLTNGTRQVVDYQEYDTNNNSLIDYIEWTVPSLSNQTYEIEINIINVHSYPNLYGNWTVMFNTTGTANLTITASRDINYSEEYTRWSDSSDNESLFDLRFLEIKCGEIVMNYSWQGTNCSENECSVVVPDYTCDQTAFEISNVLTPKRHVLKFNFGGQEVYAYNDVNISSCYTITTSGTYNLNESIYSGTTDCINIQANNVILNCMGNLINAISGATSGIYIYRGTSTNANVTIINCTITNWRGSAIRILNAHNVNMYDLTIYNNPGAAIYIGGSSNNTVEGCNIWNSTPGIQLASSSNNVIYNNFFNNTENLRITGASIWNTSLASGINIVGGSYLGGNYWAKPSGTGHSQLCNDTNGDAICDEVYIINSSNTDYLPLRYPDLIAPVVHSISPSNASILNLDKPTFNCTITDNNWIANLSLYIWNSTGDNILINSTRLKGISNQTSWNYQFAYDDNYTWSCLGVDAAGNYNWSVEGNYSLIIDRVKPIINLISPSDNTRTNESARNFSCNITDNIRIANLTLYVWNSSKAVVYINTTNLTGMYNETNWSYTFPYQNIFNWNCLGYDIAGNYNWSKQGNYSITYDFTSPVVHLAGPANGLKTSAPTQNFNCTITDNVQIANLSLYIWNSTGDLVLNQSTALSGISNLTNWSYTLPYDNIYRWNCIGYDTFGNSNWSVEGNYTLTLDRVVPVINLIGPANNTRTNASLQNFTCNITDNVQIANLTLYIWNSSGFIIYNASKSLSGMYNYTNWTFRLPYDNIYNWNCLGYDTYGNYNWSEQGNYTITFDATAPTIHLLGPVNNSKVNNPTQTFTCGINDSMGIANLTLFIWNSTRDNILENTTNLSGKSNQTSWIYTFADDGNYTWNCLGYDTMGNNNWSVEGNYTLILDRVVPVVWLVSPANNSKVNNATQTFSCNITNTVQVANLTLYIWNSTGTNILTNTTSLLGRYNRTNWTYTFSSDGNYSWNCLGYDAAGNSDWGILGNYTITLDRIKPVINLLSPANRTLTYNSTQLYNCNISDSLGISNVSLYIWYLNGSIAYLNTTNLSGTRNGTNWTYTFNNYGNYSWNCLGYDIAGNSDWSLDGNYTLVYTHNITDCITIEVPGTYYLVKDIIDSSTFMCINIIADDVVLDCLSHKIDGDDSMSYGVYVGRSSATDSNVTLKDCEVTDWAGDAITFEYANNNSIENLNVHSNPNTGIRFTYSDYNNISYSNFTDNGDSGIYLDSSSNNTMSGLYVTNNNNGIYVYVSRTNRILNSHVSDNNNGLTIYSSISNTIANSYISENDNNGFYMYDGEENSIYNNVINNTDDIYFTNVVYPNTWNTSYQLGPSIINGTYMGGNYWAKPDGSGYSENCTDINADRICDNSYYLEVDNADYLPLAAPDLILPSGTHIAIANGTITNNPQVTFSINASDGMQLANATLYVWNSTNALIYTNTTRISGTFNQTNWTYTFTYDDTFLWSVLICDTAGNCDWTHASPANWTFTVDTLAPIINLIIPTNNTKTNNVTQNFSCNITDFVGVKNLTLSIWNSTGGIVVTNTTNVTGNASQASWLYTFNFDGNYSWNCLGYDVAGNSNWSRQGNYTLYIDRVVPIIRLIIPQNRTKTNQSTNIFSCNITNSVAVANLTLYIWNSTGSNILINATQLSGRINQTNWTYAFLYEDNFKWNCLGYDAAGNYNWSKDGNFTITYDNTAPVIHLVTPQNDTRTNVSRQTFTCNITDYMKIANLTLYIWNNSGYAIYTNTTNLTGTKNQTNWTYTLPYDNIYNWNCLGYDDVGNYNWSVEGNYTLTLDRVAPVVHLLSPSNDTRTNVSTQTFVCNITDNIGITNITLYIWNSSGEVILNNATTLSGTSNQTNWTYTLPYDDMYQWNCLGYDYVRNYNWSIEGNRTLTLDRESPVIHLLSPFNDTRTNISTQTFVCNITDNVKITNMTLYIWNSSGEIIMNNSKLLSGTSNQTNWTYTLPYDNIYNWNCLGYDYVGNYNWSVEGNYTLTLDRVAPEIHLLTPLNNTKTNESTQTFVCNITDNIKIANITLYIWNSSGEIIMNNSKLLSGTSNQTNWTYTLPYDNIYNWNCLGYDYVGNYNWSVEGNYSLTYDATAPVVHLVSPINDTKTNQSNQTFTCNITDTVKIANLTLYIWNSSGDNILMNTMSLSGVENRTSWNVTLPYDNVFVWNCLGHDTVVNYAWNLEGNYTLTLDTTPPTWSNNSNNITNGTLRYNYSVSFWINWRDNIKLDSIIFSWNGTYGGSLINESATYCGTKSCLANVSKVVNFTRGKQLCWIWYANDTVNNWNSTDQLCWTVNNTRPTQSKPIVNSTSGKNTTIDDLYCYNQSFYDIDGDGLTALYQWYDDFGILVNENNWNLSHDITVEGRNYTCVVWAFDGYDNSTPANATILVLPGLTINITSPLNGSIINYSDHVPFSFNVNRLSNCSWTLDNGDYTGLEDINNYSTTLNIYSNGWHNITINCTGEGLYDTATTLFIINDTTPPNITYTSPSGIIYQTNVIMTAMTNENATCYYIPHTEGTIDTNYSDMPYNFTDEDLDHYRNLTLTNGYYEFYARCADSLGNAMTSSANISFTINIPVIQIPIAGGGGGGRREKNITKTVLLELHVPSNQTLFSGSEIKVVAVLKNKGEIALHNIRLETETNALNVSLELSKRLFETLSVGEEQTTLLTIKSLVDPKSRIGLNRYFVVLYAHVAEPVYDTLTRFFVDVEERDYELRMENLRQIQFSQDLFKEHPECLEFNEVIQQAQNSYDAYDYKGSLSTIESAIKACRGLIVYKQGKRNESVVSEELEKPALEKKISSVTYVTIIILLLAIMLALLYYYRRRKGKQPKLPKRTAKSNLETRFDDLFNETKKYMRFRNWANARSGYARLIYIYKMMRSTALPGYIKSEYYQKLLIIHKKLSKILREYMK